MRRVTAIVVAVLLLSVASPSATAASAPVLTGATVIQSTKNDVSPVVSAPTYVPLNDPEGSRANTYCVPAVRCRPLSFETYHRPSVPLGAVTGAPVANKAPSAPLTAA